ncbi:MAG TPA: hypothetical protein VGJ54_09465 [Streptosporangiaceae bacterium]
MSRSIVDPSQAHDLRFEDMASRAAELGFTDVIVYFPRAGGVLARREETLEQIARSMTQEGQPRT